MCNIKAEHVNGQLRQGFPKKSYRRNPFQKNEGI
jgi:hypothetical protein